MSFVCSDFELYLASVTVVIYAISCYIVPLYNDTRLYIGYSCLVGPLLICILNSETVCSCCDFIINIAFNTLRPGQNGRRFTDDTFKRIFLNENVRISIKISLKLVPKGPINIIPSLVQIMAWRRSGDKPLSEPKVESLLTHICVTRPQWVKNISWHILLLIESFLFYLRRIFILNISISLYILLLMESVFFIFQM